MVGKCDVLPESLYYTNSIYEMSADDDKEALFMDRAKAAKIFDTYVSNYDRDNPKIFLKALHSYKVAEISARIAQSLYREELVDLPGCSDFCTT